MEEEEKTELDEDVENEESEQMKNYEERKE